MLNAIQGGKTRRKSIWHIDAAVNNAVMGIRGERKSQGRISTSSEEESHNIFIKMNILPLCFCTLARGVYFF
jgi:hypothetical protein